MSQGDFFEGDAPLHGAKQTDDSGENTGCGCGGGKANPAPAVAPPRTNSNGGCGCSSGASQPSAAAELADSACFGTLVRDNCCRCEGLACGNNCGCGRGRVGREGGRAREREREWVRLFHKHDLTRPFLPSQSVATDGTRATGSARPSAASQGTSAGAQTASALSRPGSSLLPGRSM